mgnify:FL=1
MYRFKLVAILVFFFSYGLTDELENYETVTVVSSLPKLQEDTVLVVDKIDKEFLKKTQPKNLSSLLRESLAIDVSSNGGMGQLSSIFLRGSNSNHALVKINGIKINPSTAGGASIYNLDTELISNIEIGYGPLSAVHGSSAIGGVIDISTRPINETSQSSIGINIGPDGYQKQSFRFDRQLTDKAFFNLAASKTDTDGYPVLSNSTLDRGYENSTTISSLEINSDFAEFELSSWLAEGKIEYLVFGTPVSQDYENYAYGIGITDDIKNAFTYSLNISKSKDFIQQNDLNFLGQIDITNTHRDFVEFVISDFSFSQQPDQFILGIDAEDEEVNYLSYGTSYIENIKSKSIFTSVNLNFFENFFSASFRNTDHDKYGTNLSWNIEFLRELNQTWKVGMSNASSFRSPVSSELYGFGGNIDLKPEINKSTEINIKKINKNSDLNISLFSNKLSNLIDFDYQDYVLKNIIKSSNKGIEVRYKLNMDEWDLMILMRSQDPEDNEGKQLLRRSKTSGSLTLTKDIYGYLGTINLSNFGKRKDFGDIKLPSYSLLNLSVTKELNVSTKLSLKLENVLDKNYFTAAASNAFYLNQGRSIWFRLHYELGK